MRDFAKLLIALEAKEDNASGRNASAAFGRVIEKLRQPLAALTGVGGFRSLLSRALAMSNTDVRWLCAVHLKVDGSFECPAEMAQLAREEITKGELVLIAHLLELLVSFIGEALTLRLVQEAWPEMPTTEFDSSSTGSR